MNIFQRWKQTAVHNKALVFTGVLVAFGTLFYAGAAVVQVCIMRASSKQASRQTDKLITAASDVKAALEAANIQNRQALTSTLSQSKTALDTTIKASHLDQRPWVVISRFLLSSEPAVNTEIKISFWFANTGKTPAIGVVQQSALLVALYRPPMTKFVLPQIVPSRSILAPGTTNLRGDTTPSQIPEPHLGKYLKKSEALYFHAILRYKDVFHTDHWTTVCVIHTYGQLLDEFTSCEEGNEMDSD